MRLPMRRPKCWPQGGLQQPGVQTTLAATVVLKSAGSGKNPRRFRPDRTVVASFVRGDEPPALSAPAKGAPNRSPLEGGWLE